MVKDFDEIEEEAIKKTRKKKPNMIVSGKSVFLLAKESGKIRKPLDPFDKLRAGKTRGKKKK